jgi:hypothetical protein
VDKILSVLNDVDMLQETKHSFERCFSMNDLSEAAYILEIMIYRDRSRWLIGLSHSTFLDKIFKKFNMKSAEKGFLV